MSNTPLEPNSSSQTNFGDPPPWNQEAPQQDAPQHDSMHPNYVRANKPFPWGCLIGGCLTISLLMLVGVAVIGFGAYRFYSQQIAQYTSAEPREIPVVEVSEEEQQVLQTRLDDFKEKVDKGETPEPLVLTANDINAMISQEEQLRGRVFVTIKDGMVGAEVSFPADAFPGAKGRYFNGSVQANASLEEGVLIVTLESAEVNGLQVPEAVMSGIRQENLAKEFYKNPDAAKEIRKFESLVIEGDKIILTPRVPVKKPDDQPEGTTAETSTETSTDVESDVSAAAPQASQERPRSETLDSTTSPETQP